MAEFESKKKKKNVSFTGEYSFGNNEKKMLLCVCACEKDGIILERKTNKSYFYLAAAVASLKRSEFESNHEETRS